MVLVCTDCQSVTGKSKKPCQGGADEGWLNGKPCGKCMLNSNYGAMLRHPYDLHFTGKLVDRAGQPVTNRFVKAYLANGWSVRTKTSDQGTFRLMLGATVERKSRQPLVTDLGTLLDSRTGKDAEFSLFALPPSYKPCAETAESPQKPSKHKPSKK
jgi:hypothetical protein